ncbi:MAG: helix-turn-helix domain-containing protein [Bacteroidetes bacterium]|nr:helix-turn-helix domain-containing protein [Bacteroidota bacterium]
MAKININIHDRVELMRSERGFSKGDLSERLGIHYNTYLNYSTGQRDIPAKLLIPLAEILEVSVEWLVTGNLIEQKPTHIFEVSQHVQDSVTPYVVTVDQAGRDNVVLVDAKAAAGYLSGYGDSVYFTRLPSFRLPMLNGGLYRMFEVSGESMWPNLTSGDYVVAEFVENWQEMPTRQVYVVICIEQGIIVKRVSNLIRDVGKILCQSDNPDKENYKPIELLLPGIKEIWRVRYKISASMDLQTTYTAELASALSEYHRLKMVNIDNTAFATQLGVLKDELSVLKSDLNETKEEIKKFSN